MEVCELQVLENLFVNVGAAVERGIITLDVGIRNSGKFLGRPFSEYLCKSDFRRFYIVWVLVVVHKHFKPFSPCWSIPDCYIFLFCLSAIRVNLPAYGFSDYVGVSAVAG